MTKLMGWGTLVIYLGPALGLTPHRNATAVLAVALDGRLEVADDPASSNGTYRSTRSVLIPPNTLHHFRASGNTMAFLYVDPFSRDLAALMQKMRHVTPRAAFDLVDESAIAGVLTGLAEGRTPLREGRDALEKWLGIGMQAKPDARISSALQQMREQPGELHSLDQLAAGAGLSASRFLHLFKAQTGIPLRRYRLWNRMVAAVRAWHGGMSLTDAAHSAGFASSAHFSAAFREMFGMMPSDLLDRLEPASNTVH
jgi:AraC-like DNA-binding protein